MTPAQLAKLDKQLSSYLDYLTDGMGKPERRRALAWYMTGLLLDGESKSVVSMAGRLVDDEGDRGDAPASAAMRDGKRLGRLPASPTPRRAF